MEKINMFKMFFVIFVLDIASVEAQWTYLNGPMGGGFWGYSFASSVLNQDSTVLYVGSGYSGVYLTHNNGSNWSIVNDGLPTHSINSVIKYRNNVIVGTSLGVFMTTDDGQNWVIRSEGLTDKYIYFLAATDSSIFAVTRYKVFRSTNLGLNWFAVGGRGLIAYSGDPIQTIASMDSILIVGTNIDVFISSDFGETWAKGGIYGDVFSITTRGETIYVSTYNAQKGVFKSTDKGETWFQINNGLPLMVTEIYNYDNYLFAGTSMGIYFSSNDGVTWRLISDGISVNDCSALIVSDNYLFAGSGGIWRRPLTEIITSINETSYQIPEELKLYQNYPNPFNPITKISWQAPVSSWQTLKIYDMLGREVTILVDEFKPAGRYEVNFDASNLSSGIYLYKIQAGLFVETKKMIYLK